VILLRNMLRSIRLTWIDFWAVLALVVLAGQAHADDSILIHDLAHAAAGGIVAVAADSYMDWLDTTTVEVYERGYGEDPTPKRVHIQPWMRLAVDFASAVLVDEAYEASTNKSAAVSWEHDAWAGAAGLAVAGTSLHWEF
jgi:hypothetical protein